MASSANTGMTTPKQVEFLQILGSYYAVHGRHDLPWRQPEANGSFDPYKILVSELMLQQTQVNRVVPKYLEFLQMFPTVNVLAAAEQGEVLKAWSGLGYNRRARYLHLAAKQITALSAFPNTITELVKLPGVGKNTAGAVLAYAFNKPAVFIETNIRTVYIHHFFADKTEISDAQLIPFIEQTIVPANPRAFYWALMDYGSYLKTNVGNLNKLSKHYAQQSAFAGSKRQIRGQVLRLLAGKPIPLVALKTEINDNRLQEVLNELVREDMIRVDNDLYSL